MTPFPTPKAATALVRYRALTGPIVMMMQSIATCAEHHEKVHTHLKNQGLDALVDVRPDEKVRRMLLLLDGMSDPKKDFDPCVIHLAHMVMAIAFLVGARPSDLLKHNMCILCLIIEIAKDEYGDPGEKPGALAEEAVEKVEELLAYAAHYTRMDAEELGVVAKKS